MAMHKRRKLLALSLSFVMAISIIPLRIISPQSVKAASYGISNPRTDKNGVSTWDCIYFGSYYQSNNSTTKEPIKWRVLSVNGDDAFLLADQNLDCLQYDTEYSDSVSWETCALRDWLNNDFYNAAFSVTEKSAIKKTVVVNENNPEYGTDGGDKTNDKIYLLSIKEAMNPLYGFSVNSYGSETRRTKNTEYAIGQGAYNGYDKWTGNGWWWLRSPGRDFGIAAYVDNYGNVFNNGYVVDFNFYAVRPALHLNLSSKKWSKAGTVSSAGEGGGSLAETEEDKLYQGQIEDVLSDFMVRFRV